ncbi:MAG TPA: CRISPR-associated endonuclease Cas2 [Thermotogota bacterium]|nr:CRISPR-associated endonuclease Cas2 [Thermotogota bacterium]NLZ13014.1 CRISPR-associated endonuclease Cas2 [Thermotogaceae bacterium]MDD8053676.1 CRISPR-associated endonuclease Cas2 [Thermotogota bacterium]HNR64562.1 CRISPR-associated endonuclease Cas2 [Thermotogota bacterium]HNT96524.1 CRISPR-associated endonuclease Cas2 [Thermotogota bacterium]
MAYDVNVKRVNKVLKIGRKYLTWIQNSLLEGEITEAKFVKLKLEVQKKAKKEEDSVCYYVLRERKWLKKENYGIEKGETDFLIE